MSEAGVLRRTSSGATHRKLSVVLSAGRRVIGISLVLLVLIPFHRLLRRSETGLAGMSTSADATLLYDFILSGVPVVVFSAILLTIFARHAGGQRPIEDLADRIGRTLAAPRPLVFASFAAIAGWILTATFTVAVLESKPNLIDTMSQLVHARYLAAGRLAGPSSPFTSFWQIQNTLHTADGWLSQYPPGHIALLALGLRVGAVWAVGATVMAVTAFFTSLLVDRLFEGEERPVARLGALLVACNPFLIGLAGAYMSHGTAAACGAVTLYSAVRSRDGRTAWALAAGAALGLAFATRPLSGVVLAAIALGIIIGNGKRSAPRRPALRTIGLLCAGGAPFVVALMAYNDHFFGSPLRFGYTVAHGGHTSLGFHRDPWGNMYGAVEALAYTSTDLLALSVRLLETPLPAVVIAGLFLILARRLSIGERIIAAWALIPVSANVFYWHHGLFMGPRMLGEAAPAWAVLTTFGAAHLVRRTPADHAFVAAMPSRHLLTATFSCALLLGMLALAPARLLSYGRDFMESTRSEPPQTDEPSLIFVHDNWQVRLSMQLASLGMRLDSVETALRQNTTCELQRFVDAYAARRAGERTAVVPALDFEPRARGADIHSERVAGGSPFRTRNGEKFTPECLSQIRADLGGGIRIPPMLWQRDLPGLAGSGAMIVRDRGPEENARLIRRHTDRRPMVYFTPTPDAEPVLVSYPEGMAALWGGTPEQYAIDRNRPKLSHDASGTESRVNGNDG